MRGVWGGACAPTWSGRLLLAAWTCHANAMSCPCAQQDKPLAVPPHEVDAGALAAARAEYQREKQRIRAKHLRELQESSDFRLH